MCNGDQVPADVSLSLSLSLSLSWCLKLLILNNTDLLGLHVKFEFDARNMICMLCTFKVTLETQRGAPKSRPPDRVKPQGPPPDRWIVRVAMAMMGGPLTGVKVEKEREGRRERERERGRESRKVKGRQCKGKCMRGRRKGERKEKGYTHKMALTGRHIVYAVEIVCDRVLLFLFHCFLLCHSLLLLTYSHKTVL